MLATAVKDRSCEALWSGAVFHPNLRKQRFTVFDTPIPDRLASVKDASLSLAERALWAWFSSGVDHWPSNRLHDGDLPALLKTYLDLGVSTSVVEVTAQAIRRQREPIFTLFPLLTLIADPVPSVEHPIHPMPTEGDAPFCALDQFTRLGKRAIAEWAKSNTVLATLLSELPTNSKKTAILGLGVFYTEGFLVSPKLNWSQSALIERMGMEADLMSLGLGAEDINRLIATVTAELPSLNIIRTHLLNVTSAIIGGSHA